MDSSPEYVHFNEDEDMDDPSTSQASQTKAKTVPKKFQSKWLELFEFKGWLVAVPEDAYLAKCMACGVSVQAGKSDLNKHAKTKLHQTNVKAMKFTVPIKRGLKRKTEKEDHEENVKKMEIELCAFFGEHNVAFLAADHLVNVIKKGATDSKISQDVRLGPRKCTAIVRNIIAKTETEELVKILRNTVFSVMVDESTDVSNKKNMCILSRYVSPSRKIETRLLELIELDAHDCSGEALWQAFKHCVVEKHGIPITNVIGLSTDNAAVMTGRNNSFWTRMKAECPWAILINCTCHSAALVSRHACAELPSFVESHLRSVSSYMNDSPKRSAELKDFQELYEVELKKILKFSTTRWLVVQPCVQRYLENSESLLGFFRCQVRDDPRNKAASQILQEMENPFLKAYLFFLNFVLSYMNEFNALFQSRESLIHRLRDASVRLLKRICQNFIAADVLDRVENVNISHPSNFVSLERVYLGPECSSYLGTITIPAGKKSKEEVAKELRELKTSFTVKCLNFYVKAAAEMKERLPMGRIFQEMSFVDPQVLLSMGVRTDGSGLADLNALSTQFGAKLKLNVNALAQEWRTIPIDIDGALKEKLLSMSVEDSWSEISCLKNFSGEVQFPQLSTLAACVLSLPHSNAEAERIFSIVTDVKTNKRNRLDIRNLSAVAVVRSSFASKGINCTNFKVTNAHLEKFDSSIYNTTE